MVEDFELESIESSEGEKARAHGAAGAGMEDEDDDVPGGAERVQCASQ
jgi:DnaJ family protein A protein 2